VFRDTAARELFMKHLIYAYGTKYCTYFLKSVVDNAKRAIIISQEGERNTRLRVLWHCASVRGI
jgi:hypothetical protein